MEPPVVSKPIDKYIPWFFVLFFVVLAIVLGAFVWIAVKTNPGVVTEDAYKKGLAYNQQLEKQKQQDALGWEAYFAISKDPAKPAAVKLTVKDKMGKPLTGGLVRVTFVRPASKGADVTVDLPATGPGLYSGVVPLSLPGLWEAHATIQRGGDSFQITKRVTLP